VTPIPIKINLQRTLKLNSKIFEKTIREFHETIVDQNLAISQKLNYILLNSEAKLRLM